VFVIVVPPERKAGRWFRLGRDIGSTLTRHTQIFDPSHRSTTKKQLKRSDPFSNWDPQSHHATEKIGMGG
jgi:hypothetical protein